MVDSLAVALLGDVVVAGSLKHGHPRYHDDVCLLFAPRGLPEATTAVTGMPDRSYQLDGSWPSDRDYGANRYLSRGCASPARAGKMKGVFQCR